MSSRSIGVTKVELSRWMMSWVIRSPSCSALRISRPRPLVVGPAAHHLVEQPRGVQRVLPGLDEEVEEGAIARQEGEARHAANPIDRGGRRRLSRRPPRAARRRAPRAARAAPPGRCAARPRAAASRVQTPVGVELPGVGVVGEAALEHVEHLGPQLRVFDRRRPARPGCRGCAASGRRSPSAPGSPRRAGRRRRASARGSGRRSRRRGCSPRRPARRAAGSRSRAR